MISCMYVLQSDHHKLGLKSYCLKFMEFQFSGQSTRMFSLKGKICCFALVWFVWETREQFCGLKQSPEVRLPPIWYLPWTLESSDHSHRASMTNFPLRPRLTRWTNSIVNRLSHSQCWRASMRTQGKPYTRGAPFTLWHKTSISFLEPPHLFGNWTCVRPGTSSFAQS